MATPLLALWAVAWSSAPWSSTPRGLQDSLFSASAQARRRASVCEGRERPFFAIVWFSDAPYVYETL